MCLPGFYPTYYHACRMSDDLHVASTAHRHGPGGAHCLTSPTAYFWAETIAVSQSEMRWKVDSSAHHVGEGGGGEGLQAQRAAGAEDGDRHERLQHLDEGHAEVEVRRIAQPQRA